MYADSSLEIDAELNHCLYVLEELSRTGAPMHERSLTGVHASTLHVVLSASLASLDCLLDPGEPVRSGWLDPQDEVFAS